jgi:hypothetical protein
MYNKLKNALEIKCSSFKKNDYYMYLLNIESFNFNQKRSDFLRQLSLIRMNSFNKYMGNFKEKTDIKLFQLNEIIENPVDFRGVFYNSIIKNIDIIKSFIQ